MKALGLFVLITVGFALADCSPEKTIDLHSKDRSRSEYLHLHSIGGWGIDGDFWILPDDTYRVRYVDSHAGEIDTEYVGYQAGLFTSLTTMANDSKVSGEHPGLFYDCNHDFIEFRLKDHTLVADFEATNGFAKKYPSAKQMNRFNDLLNAIRKVANRR
jgi:hypothetical protein